MKTIAEVLTEHYLLSSAERCACGYVFHTGVTDNTRKQYACHTADAIATAGYGLVREAQEQAWEVGMADAKLQALGIKPLVKNPYYHECESATEEKE